MAAFPAGYVIARDSNFNSDKSVQSWVMPDLTPIQEVVSGDATRITIRCSIKHIDASDFATLETFLRTNRHATVTMTIDNIDYSGIFIDGYNDSKIGDVYSVDFIYNGEVV